MPDSGDIVGARDGGFPVLLLGLTCVHHAYGAVIYDTPWRLHVALIAVPLAVAIVPMLRSRKVGLRRAAALLILAVPVLLIGLFEGGYNHFVKNIVYFASGAREARLLFPPPTYEMPTDAFFELSGIAQFFLAPFAAAAAIKILRGAQSQREYRE